MKFPLVCAALAVALAAPAAHADVPAGYVKTLAGSVTLTEGNTTGPVKLGTPVSATSVLRTGGDGTVGVALRDDTLLSLGPNTEFSFREYAFAPESGKLSLVARITRGTLNYVSGVIAKLKPDAVSVETPSGLLGVRGTHFVVKVEEGEVAK